MKSYLRRINVRTSHPVELINVTGDVRRVVEESGVRNGVAVVFSLHTTLAVYVNEDEGRLRRDLLNLLEKLAPKGAGYLHDEIDRNAHSHLRSILLNPSVTIPVADGSLLIGTWQSIFLAEFDGPRRRSYVVQVIGE